MRRVVAGIFALSTGLFSFSESSDSASPTLGVESAGADEPASNCVDFYQSESKEGIVFEASSSCDRKLTCSLSWVLTCSTDNGRVTQRAAQSRRFALHANTSTEETVNAGFCAQSWRIDDVRWRCQEAK